MLQKKDNKAQFNIYKNQVRETKRHKNSNPADPYEDFVRLEKLDAYEAQIKSNLLLKKNKKSIE